MNIEGVKQLVGNDPRLTKRMIAEELGIGTESVRLILTEDLGKGKLYCRLVPLRFTPEQMDWCLALAETSLTWQMETNFLNSNVTGDDSWSLKYDPESKHYSLEGWSPSSPIKTKVRSKKSCIETMLIAFFVSKGLIPKEFLPNSTTLNDAAYAEIQKYLLKRIRRVRLSTPSKVPDISSQ